MEIKITHVTSESFEWEKPAIWNGSHFYGLGRLHKVAIHTDQGICGYGWNGGTAATRPQHFLKGYVDYYRDFLVGRNPLETSKLVLELGEKQNKILGSAGLHTQVLGALMVACWDIKGKVEGKSVHQLLGGARDRVRAYIAGGYYAEGKGLKELQDEVLYNVEELHSSAVKIKVGDPSVGFAEDIKRVEAARSAIGDDIDLLVDANCAFDLDTAIEFAKAIEPYNIYWFEEPITMYDFAGHKTLADSSSVKIATGENYYLYSDFDTLTANGGATYLNVDVTICPGFDIALQVADLAEKRNLQIAPHGCQEIHLPLVAGVAKGGLLEYYPPEVDPLRGDMILPQLRLEKDGHVTVPTTPGLGYELNMDLLNRYRVG